MTGLAVPYAAAAVLLVASGWTTLQRPGSVGDALAQAGLPSSDQVARVWAIVEIGVGVAGLLSHAWYGALSVGVAYLALSAFVLHAIRRGTVRTCGCFGSHDAPPTALHVAVNLSFASVGVAMATLHWPGLVQVLDRQPLFGLPFVMITLTVVVFVQALLTALPRAMAAIHRVPSP
jgi:hypothetical protein